MKEGKTVRVMRLWISEIINEAIKGDVMRTKKET